MRGSMRKKIFYFVGIASFLLLLFVIAGCTPLFPQGKLIKDAESPTLPEPEEVPPSLPVEEEQEKVPQGRDILVTATVTHPVNIYGRNGFAPEVITISAGDSITWTNRDPQMKEVTLTFHEEGTRRFRTSRVIPSGEEEEIIFPEKVNYTYWTVAYGTQGKIIVR